MCIRDRNAGNGVAQGQHTYGPFTRETSAYNVTCWGKAWGETVNGYGAWAGSAEVYTTVTVPARPVYAPPAATGVTNTRQDDSRNVVAWANQDVYKRQPYRSAVPSSMAPR